jgi:hypothetical protein
MSGGYEVDNELDLMSDYEIGMEEHEMRKNEKIKHRIEDAISKVAFTFHESYDLYLYVLNTEEEEKERAEVEEARNYLAEVGIAYDAAFKHAERFDNIEPRPVRFIDRHLKPVETDELPF